MSMIIETVSVAAPLVRWKGRDVLTSIFKGAVAGPVRVRGHNLEGDRQSDLAVHGGEYKGVYAYAAEDYGWWSEALGRDLETANFGENP
jgi:MOSC domain-containing protein YiiM